MNILYKFIFISLIFLVNQEVIYAKENCHVDYIVAKAKVSISDGKSYSIKTIYKSATNNAINFYYDESSQNKQIISEGPWGWASNKDKRMIGSVAQQSFALGHQFHALINNFEEITGSIQEIKATLGDKEFPALQGVWPFGGKASLVYSADKSQLLGLKLEFPNTGPIEVTFDDWEKSNYGKLPYHLTINHEQRTFSYQYQFIEKVSLPLNWFENQYEAEGLDEIVEFRKSLKEECSKSRD